MSAEVRAVDVAAYIMARIPENDQHRLHLLTYYSQAWAMAWAGPPLFRDPIEAGSEGPVIAALANVHEGEPSRLAGNPALIVDAVLAFYAEFSVGDLADLVRSEDPWLDARACETSSSGNVAVISHSALRKYYCKKSVAGEAVPHPPFLEKVHLASSMDEFSARLAAQKQKWAITLAWLAEH